MALDACAPPSVVVSHVATTVTITVTVVTIVTVVTVVTIVTILCNDRCNVCNDHEV